MHAYIHTYVHTYLQSMLLLCQPLLAFLQCLLLLPLLLLPQCVLLCTLLLLALQRGFQVALLGLQPLLAGA